MKTKLLIATMMFTCVGAWAADAPAITKDVILKEVKAGCLQVGNTEQACDCSIKGFDEKISKEEWDLLVTPPKNVTQANLDAFNAIQTKMAKVAEECGATKQ